ncbi:MAG TPA: hypothetical protein DER33_09215 [Syntrophomonas sp.]|jgi:hypothetical protein|nr:hypothetical protein [Syntrophomonas sp.]
MAHESFEDEEVAKLLNDDYLCIKVDREERPDIDHIYMSVCQAMTGQGGWPLTIIMTPDQKPFFAATYLPKKSGRMVGLMELLPRVAQMWREQRDLILNSGDKIYNWMKDAQQTVQAGAVTEELLHLAFESLATNFDQDYGGFGSAPKFPSPHNLMFLLRYNLLTEDGEALTMVRKTLESMYRGGIYDHIGFGFARYSTDKCWLVPHFEKMLYDNALLAMAYLEAFQISGEDLYKQVAGEIFTYVLRDMTSPEGGFYSAEDADSEGEEGKFYLWQLDEVKEILGEEDGTRFSQAYDITPGGNFEGKNIPNLIDQRTFHNKASFEKLREKLLAYREKRVHPHKDDKILTSWNGLMIAALALGARILQDNDYLRAAEKAVAFILKHLRRDDGRLLASYRDGEARYPAYAGDYANLIWGLLELYQTTFKAAYLKLALELNDDLLKYFWDTEQGGVFLYGEDAEQLAARPKEWFDGAMPSANSVTALNLLQLSRLTGDQKLVSRARAQIEIQAGAAQEIPSGHTFYLMAVALYLSRPQEIVIAGKDGDADTLKMLKILHSVMNPFTLAAFKDIGDDKLDALIPHTVGMKMVDGKASAYICEDFSCRQPINNVAEFQKALKI